MSSEALIGIKILRPGRDLGHLLRERLINDDFLILSRGSWAFSSCNCNDLPAQAVLCPQVPRRTVDACRVQSLALRVASCAAEGTAAFERVFIVRQLTLAKPFTREGVGYVALDIPAYTTDIPASPLPSLRCSSNKIHARTS